MNKRCRNIITIVFIVIIIVILIVTINIVIINVVKFFFRLYLVLLISEVDCYLIPELIQERK